MRTGEQARRDSREKNARSEATCDVSSCWPIVGARVWVGSDADDAHREVVVRIDQAFGMVLARIAVGSWWGVYLVALFGAVARGPRDLLSHRHWSPYPLLRPLTALQTPQLTSKD